MCVTVTTLTVVLNAAAETSPELVVQTGHTNRVHLASFSPDGKRIVTASDDNTAIVWDAASGQELLTLRSASGSVNRAVFTTDGMHLLATGPVSAARRSDPVQVWDATPLLER